MSISRPRGVCSNSSSRHDSACARHRHGQQQPTHGHDRCNGGRRGRGARAGRARRRALAAPRSAHATARPGPVPARTLGPPPPRLAAHPGSRFAIHIIISVNCINIVIIIIIIFVNSIIFVSHVIVIIVIIIIDTVRRRAWRHHRSELWAMAGYHECPRERTPPRPLSGVSRTRPRIRLCVSLDHGTVIVSFDRFIINIIVVVIIVSSSSSNNNNNDDAHGWCLDSAQRHGRPW
jgi:hypothetical protein